MLYFQKNGMVSTTQPLAAESGLEILKKRWQCSGCSYSYCSKFDCFRTYFEWIRGGDGFAIIWYKDRLYGLNASGWAPREITIDRVRNMGYNVIPKYGFFCL